MLIGDVHLSDRAPSSCTETYTEDLFELLDEVCTGCSMMGAEACIIAGDLFHIKVPHRTSFSLVLALCRLLKAFPCPVYVVPGNHDMQHDRRDSLDDQPLGMVFETGAAQPLEGWADNPDGSLRFPIYGVAWQQEWSESTISAALRDYTEPTGGEWEKPMLVVTHAPVYPPGQEPTYEGAECTPASWWADGLNQGSVFYGHIHEPHGVYEVGGVRFCNNGALSRGSLDEYNLARPVVATVWDSGTGEFSCVGLHAKPAEEVFRLREKEKIVTSNQRLDAFLADIGMSRLEVMSVESVIADIKQRANVRPEVKSLAEALVSESWEDRK